MGICIWILRKKCFKPRDFSEDWKIHLIETGLNTMTEEG